MTVDIIVIAVLPRTQMAVSSSSMAGSDQASVLIDPGSKGVAFHVVLVAGSVQDLLSVSLKSST